VKHPGWGFDVKILTVCRMNQARSPFAQAVITKFFPEIQITSVGIEAISGIPYLPEVISIARRWGIEISTGSSRSISTNPEFQMADLIICAEERMSAEVNLMNPAGRVRSYESVVPDLSFMPTDPERLRGRRMETELAKVAWINIKAVNDFLEVPRNNQIICVIPKTDLDVEVAIDWMVRERLARPTVVIDADLRSPLARNFRARGLRVGGFSSLNQVNEFDVFSSIVEQPEPERTLLSPEWRAQLDGLGTDRQILMITSPQMTQDGPLPDSYLASIPAGNIEIIGS